MPTAEEIHPIVHDEVSSALRRVLYGDNRDESKDGQTHPDSQPSLAPAPDSG